MMSPAWGLAELASQWRASIRATDHGSSGKRIAPVEAG